MLGKIQLILIFITSVIVFFLIKNIFQKNIPKFAIEFIDSNFKKSSKGIVLYNNLEQYLRKMGLKESISFNIRPTEFLIVQVLISLILLVAFAKENIFLALLSCVFGFFLPLLILKISNYYDNEEILPDLKKVYDTLRIQTKAGVFLTTSLTECYLVVKNPRLKKALLELNNNILNKKDFHGAVDDFNLKFKNIHIDTFCIVLKQSIDSGKTVQLLEDLASQIKDIQNSINIKVAENVKKKLEILQFFIYIGVISTVVYGIFVEITGSLLNF